MLKTFCQLRSESMQHGEWSVKNPCIVLSYYTRSSSQLIILSEQFCNKEGRYLRVAYYMHRKHLSYTSKIDKRLKSYSLKNIQTLVVLEFLRNKKKCLFCHATLIQNLQPKWRLVKAINYKCHKHTTQNTVNINFSWKWIQMCLNCAANSSMQVFCNTVMLYLSTAFCISSGMKMDILAFERQLRRKIAIWTWW